MTSDYFQANAEGEPTIISGSEMRAGKLGHLSSILRLKRNIMKQSDTSLAHLVTGKTEIGELTNSKCDT